MLKARAHVPAPPPPSAGPSIFDEDAGFTLGIRVPSERRSLAEIEQEAREGFERAVDAWAEALQAAGRSVAEDDGSLLAPVQQPEKAHNTNQRMGRKVTKLAGKMLNWAKEVVAGPKDAPGEKKAPLDKPPKDPPAKGPATKSSTHRRVQSHSEGAVTKTNTEVSPG